MTDKVCIIAEAGVNHNGNFDLACRLIEAAAEAGADVVKFQTFRSDALVATDAAKAVYQARQTGAQESQHAMLKRLELSFDDFRRLSCVAKDAGIGFLSTPFDIDSLRFLVNDLGSDRIKLGSGEVTNGPILLAAARLGCDIILSTGMSTLDEVADAVSVLAYGYTAGPADTPTRANLASALGSRTSTEAIRRHVVLLHCTSQYPAPAQEVNLRAIDTLRETFGTVVGFSDHTEGIAVALGAVARGARVVEKHLTLDRNLPGPDHIASIEPNEFALLVQGIRQIEAALGDGIKSIQPSELDTRKVARKSLVASSRVGVGEPFTERNLGVLRPGTGISPIDYWDWLGRRANRDYRPGEMVHE